VYFSIFFIYYIHINITSGTIFKDHLAFCNHVHILCVCVCSYTVARCHKRVQVSAHIFDLLGHSVF